MLLCCVEGDAKYFCIRFLNSVHFSIKLLSNVMLVIEYMIAVLYIISLSKIPDNNHVLTRSNVSGK